MMAVSLQKLKEYIGSCAFVHDDWYSPLGINDWDQYDTNPFLLGASSCVVSTLLGFGDDYLTYLHSLSLLPSNIIVPRRVSLRLIQNLLHDFQALELLKDAIQTRKLDLSTFYAYDAEEAHSLKEKLATEEHVPRVQPAPKDFNFLENRLNANQIFHQLDIPTPLTEVINSIRDLKKFLGFALNNDYKGLILKRGHRNSIVIYNEADLDEQRLRITFPVFAEVLHEVVSSPVSQMLIFDGEILPLFTLEQTIKAHHFCGNFYPSTLPDTLLNLVQDYASRVASVYPNYNNVIGVDFILVKSQELLAVDLNPRFNSSTYPLYFAHQHMESQKVSSYYVKYQIVEDRPVKNLGFFLTKNLPLLTATKSSGIFLFNPVFDFENDIVKKWSYLIIGHSIREVTTFERMLYSWLLSC